MASDERLASSLQTAVLGTLCLDGPFGAAISIQVTPEHFDGVYRDFAAIVLKYRKHNSRPPGKSNILDLAVQSSYGKENSPVITRLVPAILDEADSLNPEYIASRVKDFIRRQNYKSAIVEASDRYGLDDDRMLDDIEQIFSEALRSRKETLSIGTFLNEPKALAMIANRTKRDFIPLGITQLDRLGIGPAPKQLLLYIGPKGSGKSWFCVHVGKQALYQRQKVAHITLEMGEDEVIPRYFQSFFAAAETPDRTNITVLEFDKVLNEKLIGFKAATLKPRMSFSDSDIKKKIQAKSMRLSSRGGGGIRLGGLVVKEFPTSQLTMSQLNGYLDFLEENQFIPNVLIVDYPKLMKLRTQDLRLELGRTVEELRGIAMQRNLAVVCPHQGIRASINARRVRSNMAGEDISVVQTADQVLAFSRTEAEEEQGLGRLSVEHSRNSRGGLMLLLTQSYATGQYVLESADMQPVYWEKLKKVSGGKDGDNEDD